MSITSQQITTKYQDKTIDIDGSYGWQCWDLSVAIARDIMGNQSFTPGCAKTGGVADWINDKKSKQVWLDAGWVWEDNDYNNPDQVPETPAIFVVSANAYLPYGHTGCILNTYGNQNKIDIIEQNTNDGSGEGYSNRSIVGIGNYDKIAGWFSYPQPIDFNKPNFEKSLGILQASGKFEQPPFKDNQILIGAFQSSKDLDYIGFEFIERDKTRFTLETENTDLKVKLTTLTNQLNQDPVKKNDQVPSQELEQSRKELEELKRQNELDKLVKNPLVQKANDGLLDSKTFWTLALPIFGGGATAFANFLEIINYNWCLVSIVINIVFLFSAILVIIYKKIDQSIIKNSLDSIIKTAPDILQAGETIIKILKTRK